MGEEKPATFYNEYYYTHCCGLPYKRDDEWMRFFNTIAEEIKVNISPKTVLDAGCAMGFLVESLRQKDVETWGIDISEYAIQNAHPSIQPYCSVGSVTEALPRQYDLIVCIEVLEHLTRQQAEQAIKNFCQHTDDILFSSSPLDYKEATHFNVQPSEYWAEQFAKQGFIRDVDFDASFITPWAVRFRRNHEPLHRIVREYERIFWLLRKENLDLRESVLESYKQIGNLEKIAQELTAKVVDLNSQLEQYQSQLQQTQSELEQWKLQERKTQSELEQWKSQLQQTQSELEQWKSQWQKTQTELEQWKFQWQKAQSELEHRKYNGEKTQSELIDFQFQLQKTQAELQCSQSQLQKTQTELEISKSELIYAQTSINAMQTSKFWKLRKAWFKVKALLKLVPASEMFADNQILNIINKSEDIPKNSNSSPEDLSTNNTSKMFAFISGCPGDAYRYRCHHQAEILKYLGYTVDVYEPMVFSYNQLLIQYKIIIAHRIPHTAEFEDFVFNAKKLSIKVIFDTDDLVFDPSRIFQIDAYVKMDEQEKALYKDGVNRYCRALSLCDYITVSTNKLQQEIKQSFPNKISTILRNRISNEMEQGAIEARKSYVPNDGMLRIAYFSGTKTHVKDFAECVLALKSILIEFPYVRLMLVGHLDIPEALQEVTSQIECVPYMPWRDLPILYRKVDINLAPLEKNNDFTESKSELKYFEAALLSVPTIASDTSAFRIAIQNGVNGLICNNFVEWKNALYQLVTDHKLRQKMGEKAFEDVKSRYLTRVAASETMKEWKNLLGGALSSNKPLSIAFILRAPIAQTGGGYKHIFNLAYYLAAKRHSVNIYIEPIAHLSNFTREEVTNFCEDNFGKSNATIHCGHTDILESDIAIATNWPTAYVVDKLVNTRLKAYYVQDYEPYFYKAEETNFAQAEATYDLPLSIITLGRYLAEILSQRNQIHYPYIDFPLSEVFLAKIPILERHLSTKKPCSILFFARPHIPRRNFALGVEALNKLYNHNSEVQIKLYGLEEALELPFIYENLGVLTQAETAEAMRSSDIHLSFSMTNISTVVFEAMACGCATVEVDVPPVRAMVKEGACLLCEPNSESVFNALRNLVNNPEMRQKVAMSGYESVQHLTLQNMCIQFEEIIIEYSFRSKN